MVDVLFSFASSSPTPVQSSTPVRRDAGDEKKLLLISVASSSTRGGSINYRTMTTCQSRRHLDAERPLPAPSRAGRLPGRRSTTKAEICRFVSHGSVAMRSRFFDDHFCCCNYFVKCACKSIL